MTSNSLVEGSKDLPLPKLTKVISDILAEKGHPHPTAWQEGLHPDAYSENLDIQRFQITAHWARLLAAMPEDTRFARYCLNDSGTVKVWLQAFEKGVIPLIMSTPLVTVAPVAG